VAVGDRARADAASAGRVPTAPNACLILDACMVPVNDRGNADANLAGRAIYATRSSLTATSIPLSAETTPLASA